MKQLVFEGAPKLLAQFDKELVEEFTALGIVDQVTVKSETVQARVAPGEMGFGEEIIKIMIGVADILEAGKETISKVAEGLAKRLAQGTLIWEILPDGTVKVKEKTSGKSNVAESAKEFAKILEAMKS